LLVVIAIIGLLVSLTTAAIQRVRVTQAVRTSENIVTKIQMGIDNQVKVIADGVRRELPSPANSSGSKDFSDMLTACGGGSANEDLAAAVLMYCRLRQNFPQTSGELTTTMTAAPLAGQLGFTFGGVNFPRPIAFNAINGFTGSVDQVSAAALYAALAGRTIGGNTFAADEALAGAQMDVAVGPVSARMFKDGWGNPICFQRFFQSAELDAPPYCDGKFGTGPAPGKDPFDSAGKIYSWSGANKTTLQTILGYSPTSWGHNTTVLAYSFGTNKTPDAPLGVVDDILGYRLRSIGASGRVKP